LVIGKSVVMLNHDAKIFPHHLDEQARFDFTHPCAEMTRHPTDPNIWGIKNLSGESWSAVAPDSTVREVPPGRSLPLLVGSRIYFGRVEGQILA
jgi:hypothetical protein